eukprot:4722480-Amphidinium_carterae.2
MQFCQLEADLHLDRVPIGRIQVTNGVRQGAAISPLLWVVGLWFILADLINDWFQTYPGCSLDSALLHIIIYADDILILASDVDELRGKSTALQLCLASHSMQISIPKLEVLLNDAWQSQYGNSITLLGRDCVSSSCMGYLGTMLSSNGRTGDAFEHALTRGWRSFHARAPQLLGRAPLRSRIRFYYRVVAASALYASQLWTLSQRQCQRLRSMELEHIRRMLRLARRPDETPLLYKSQAVLGIQLVIFMCAQFHDPMVRSRDLRLWPTFDHLVIYIGLLRDLP